MPLLSGLLKTIGAGYEGYGADKRQILAEAAAAQSAKRLATKDAIDAAIAQRTLRTPVLGDPSYITAQRDLKKVDTDAAVAQAKELSPINVQEAVKVAEGTAPSQRTTHAANRDYDVNHPLPVTPNIGTATVGGTATEPGKVITYDQHTGKPVGELGDAKTPGNTGTAAITKAIASNKTQLSVIDDALRELDANPDAVGLMRGLPWVGDRLDPRADPAGVAARAQIANVGSLKIHDRSGAAVSVHEFPRLAPFIPSISDPPEAIRTKLKKLRDAIEVETAAMQPTSAAKPPADSGDAEFDALMAKYKKP